MIFIKRIYLILLLWICVVSGILIFLFGTNFGTNLIFRGIAYYIPELTFGSVSGNWGNFHITDLSYNFSKNIVNIDAICVSINLKYIFLKQINIEHCFLKTVFIKTKKVFDLNNVPSRNNINNIFKNLYPIVIKNLVLDSIYVELDNFEFRCKKMNSGLILNDNVLKILPTRMIEGSILNKLFENIFFDAIDSAMVRRILCSKSILNIKPIFVSMMKKMFTILTNCNLPIDLIFTNIQGENFHISNNNHDDNYHTVHNFQLQAISNKSIADIKLDIVFPHGYLRSMGHLILSKLYPINIVVDYMRHDSIISKNHQKDKSESNIRNINFTLTGSLIDTICIRCDFYNIISVVHILSKITLKDFNVPIELFITGKLIPIPIFRENKYILEKFDLYLKGTIHSNFYVKIMSKIVSLNKNTAYVSCYAQGNSDSFTITQLKLKILNGFYKIQGIVQWKDAIIWNNTCIFNDIFILKKYLKSPITLSGKIVTQGCISTDMWELTISEFSCHGYIENNEVMCNGSLYIGSQKQFSIPIFFINWGSNRLEIQGEVQKNGIININSELKIADCSDFSSKLSNGTVYGYCKIYGPMESPQLSLKIEIKSLAAQDQKINIDYITVISNFFYKNPIRNDFFIKFNQIRYKDLLLNQLFIRGEGYLKNSNINITICSDEISGIINCVGTFDPKSQIWTGQINKTKIFTPIGTWELMKDIVCIYHHSLQKFILKSHYWESTNCQFVTFNSVQKQIFEKIDLVLKKYYFKCRSIMPIQSISVSDIRISCTDIDWIIGKDKYLPKGTIFLESSKSSIKYLNAQNISNVTIDNITLYITLDQTEVFCRCIVKTHENQSIIKFSIVDLYNDKPKILGMIQIKNVFFHSIYHSSLKVDQFLRCICNININFKGYLYCPEIYGVLKLESLQTNHVNIPFDIKNGILEINFFGNDAVLNGIIETECKGKLHCNGKITNFHSINDVCVLLNIKGKQIDINFSPTIHAKIFTDLVCIITAEKINITGDIIVPSADIIMQELKNNVIEISSEEIILDDQHCPILDKSKNFFIFVSSMLNIYLGDNVNFNGLGLNAKLHGHLEMIYNNYNLSLMGPVNISSGYVEVYGQNLMIKKGQLLFSGSINQTYFDIEAIKTPAVVSYIKNSIIAGIRISGLINQLRLDFFSDASSFLSQQEIVSYLLGGYDSMFSNVNDTNMLTSLLIGISIKQCEKILNRIGLYLGIQDLKLCTKDTDSPSLIELSGYIAPGLQIQYGVNIFDLLTTVTVRYCIYPKLYLEAKSGSHKQSLDLLYQFDSD